MDNLKLIPEKGRKRDVPLGRFHKILFTLPPDLLSIRRGSHAFTFVRAANHYIFHTNRMEVHTGEIYRSLQRAPRRRNGREWDTTAYSLLSWTQRGITDYSLSRPICQAARTTRSQALYCKIKWFASNVLVNIPI